MKTIEEVIDHLENDLRKQEEEVFEMSHFYIEDFVEDIDINETDDTDEINDIIQTYNIYYGNFDNVDYVSVDDCQVCITYYNKTEIEFTFTDFNDTMNITRIEGYIIYINGLLNKLKK